MGEGGIAPDYFMREMGPKEATDFVAGFSKRQRPGWEQTRLLANVICRLLGGGDSGIEFPWERPVQKEKSLEDEMKEIEALRILAKNMEDKL